MAARCGNRTPALSLTGGQPTKPAESPPLPAGQAPAATVPPPTALPTAHSDSIAPLPEQAEQQQQQQQQRVALTCKAGDLSKAHLLAGRERHFLEEELRVRPAKASMLLHVQLPHV